MNARSMFGDLKPWFGVATPHEDIRKGQLSEAVFAANLWAVVQGNAPDVYLYPEPFFTKTYLTAGLTNVLRKVSRALSGNADSGDRILSLQTAFGGGKTHTLVALWHLARHTDLIRKSSACADVSTALGEVLPQQVKGVAVFTNQTCDATQGRQTPEGIHTRTLWGELALQLGGVELYRKVEANDQGRTVPQGLFADILQQAAPCLILLDELADYCVGASAVEVGAATLADQTISFAQQLTEAVQQVKGVALVATLPASHLEVASSEKGQEILNRLERRFGRMSADIKPVADEEIYEVVRRRLFETLGDPAEHERAADAYMKMYQQHKNEVPTDVARGTYKERIIAAYPFHPTLIDAFSLRWGSHSDFQRTRGVLRLLASIVGDLWQRRNTETQSQPLIQPCHLRWTVDALQAALTRLWGAAYDSVVAADVIGDKANAAALDEERGGDYLTEKITQGLAASILLGSFGGQGERAGYSTKDLKLCVSRPTLNWSYADGALLTFDDERAFYLHNASAGSLGKRYWFGTTANLNKLVVQYRAQFATQDFDAEINETVQKQVEGVKSDSTWRILVNPESDLPEQKSLALLILPAACAYSENGGQRLLASPAEERVAELSQKCGSKDRRYRNTLLFLLPSSRGLAKLRSALREVTALEAVKRDYGTKLDAEQAKDLEKRLEAARKSVTESVGAAYSYAARIEGQELVTVALSDAKPVFSDHLKLVWDQVIDEEWVLQKVGAVTLQKAGLIPTTEGIRVKDALEAFLRYTDKPMLASREALMQGLKEACKDKLVSIGRGLNLNNLQKRWCGEDVVLDPNEEGLWILPPFEKEQPQPTTPADAGGIPTAQTHPPSYATGTATGSQSGSGPTVGEGAASGTVGGTTNQITKIRITGNVPVESWADVFRSFVLPASRMNLGKMGLGINFELVTKEGHSLDQNDASLKAMKEAARQLGLQLDEE